MQQAYDLWYMENKIADELSKIETVPIKNTQHRIKEYF